MRFGNWWKFPGIKARVTRETKTNTFSLSGQAHLATTGEDNPGCSRGHLSFVHFAFGRHGEHGYSSEAAAPQP